MSRPARPGPKRTFGKHSRTLIIQAAERMASVEDLQRLILSEILNIKSEIEKLKGDTHAQNP